jgi:hypothetical protein
VHCQLAAAEAPQHTKQCPYRTMTLNHMQMCVGLSLLPVQLPGTRLCWCCSR